MYNQMDDKDLGTWQAMKCTTCKVTAWSLRTVFGNNIARSLFNEFLKIICRPIAKYLLNYNPEICPGTIDQQFRDSIFPVLFDQFLTTQTLCTFELELCDMDKWEKLSIDAFIDEKLSTKPDHLKGNDYLNKMY